MSDLKFHDAVCCWVEGDDLHATFHYTLKIGSRSLALWRFTNCMKCSCPSHDCASCLPFIGKCLAEPLDWHCSWCGEDQHVCDCEVDANGLVWSKPGKLGVDLPF